MANKKTLKLDFIFLQDSSLVDLRRQKGAPLLEMVENGGK